MRPKECVSSLASQITILNYDRGTQALMQLYCGAMAENQVGDLTFVQQLMKVKLWVLDQLYMLYVSCRAPSSTPLCFEKPLSYVVFNSQGAFTLPTPRTDHLWPAVRSLLTNSSPKHFHTEKKTFIDFSTFWFPMCGKTRLLLVL